MQHFPTSLYTYSAPRIATILLVMFVFIASSHYASASIISIGDAPSVLDSTRDFYLDVVLDTEGETINAIEGVLTYPDDVLELVDIYNGRTMVTSWMIPPKQSGSSIEFAGIMAGGFEQIIDPQDIDNPPTSVVFRVVFRPLRAGSGVISFDNVHVYLHDGLGTEAGVRTISFPFTLQSYGVQTPEVIVDTEGPDPFVPIISQHNDVYDGKYFLVFSTRDAGTGVAYYEVQEGRGPWIRATSPYLLTDQSLKSRIRVVAYDNAGNSTVSTLGERQRIYSIIGVILLLLIIIYIARRYYKSKEERK